MFDNIITTSMVGLLWLAALRLLRAGRRSNLPGSGLLWAAIGGPAIAATVVLGPIYVWFYTTTGVANIALLIAYMCMCIGAWAAQAFLAQSLPTGLSGRDAAQRRGGVLLLATLPLLGILFSLAFASMPNITTLDERCPTTPLVAAFWAVWLLSLGSNWSLTIRHALRLSHREGISNATRRGLHLIATGVLLALAHRVFLYAIYPLLHVAGLASMNGRAQTIASQLNMGAYIGAGLVAVGIIGPALVAQPPASRISHWSWQLTAYRRMSPLQKAVGAAENTHVLADRWAWKSIDYLLHFRAVGIRDGLLRLRPYWPPEHDLRSELDRLDSPSDTAVEEAMAVRLALQARNDSQPPPTCESRQPDTTPRDYRAEVDWLSQVSGAYHDLVTSKGQHPSPRWQDRE